MKIEELNKMDACRHLLPEPGAQVAGELIAEVRRLMEVERIEYDNRGTIQHHINRAELPRNIPSTDCQPAMVGHIVDELNSARAKLDWLKANCRVVFYGPAGSYPIEHAPHAKKDCFDLITEQMPATA